MHVFELVRILQVIVVGGEDEKVGVKGADEQIERFKRLEDWMRQRYPMAGKVTNQWSGQIIEPIGEFEYFMYLWNV